MAADWTAIKLAYINSSKTLREVAEEFGVKAPGVFTRAAKENWQAERKQIQDETSKIVNESLKDLRVSELAMYNAADLDAAKEIRNKALQMMEAATGPHELKAIAGAIDTASKVARLALGVATENATITTKELPTSVEEFV
jgi:hypothetical protein